MGYSPIPNKKTPQDEWDDISDYAENMKDRMAIGSMDRYLQNFQGSTSSSGQAMNVSKISRLPLMTGWEPLGPAEITRSQYSQTVNGKTTVAIFENGKMISRTMFEKGNDYNWSSFLKKLMMIWVHLFPARGGTKNGK